MLGLDVEEYARLRLAATVLHEAIERYRQRSQGPILDRAGGHLPPAHAGLLRRLKVGYDDQDRPTLQAIRTAGSRRWGSKA